MDGWNTTFLLGWPIFRGELLVSGSVSMQKLETGTSYHVSKKWGDGGYLLPCQPRGMMVEVGVVKVDVEQFVFVHVWVIYQPKIVSEISEITGI